MLSLIFDKSCKQGEYEGWLIELAEFLFYTEWHFSAAIEWKNEEKSELPCPYRLYVKAPFYAHTAVWCISDARSSNKIFNCMISSQE